MKQYRVVIVGLGRAGSTLDEEMNDGLPHSIAGACAASDRLECVAGSDIDSSRIDDFKSRWGINSTYKNY